MPRIRRWFHVSHDINSDGEVWELTDKYGVTGLRVWLELLSIADRNEGRLPPLSDSTVRQLSIKCNSSQSRVRVVLDFTLTKLWVVCDPDPRVRNWAIYNPSREDKRSQTVSPPIPPNPPILTKPSKKHKNASSLPPPPAEAIECAQLLSDRIFDNFPNRTAPTEAQLMSWARDADKLNRIDSHSWAEIRDLVEWVQQDDFWRSNILSMSKLREKWNQLIAKKEKPNGARTSEPKGIAGLEEWRRLRGIDSR